MTVNLIDVNDNAPVFIDSGDIQVYITEDTPVDTMIYTISTVDVDINSITGYQIEPSNVSLLFSINSMGHLLLNRTLDRESAIQYQLTITTYDMEIPSLNNTIDVYINVLDSNDHYPVFTQPFYAASIREVCTA